jgi:hypothetical protein
VPTATPEPTATPSVTQAPLPVISIGSDGKITATVTLKAGLGNKVLIDHQTLLAAFNISNIDIVSLIINNVDEKTQVILSADVIKELSKLGLDISVVLRNANDEEVAIWTYSADELKAAKGKVALNLSVHTSRFNKDNATGGLKKIKAKLSKAVLVSLEDGLLPARGELTLLLKEYSDFFVNKDKVYIYRVDEVTGDLLEIPETIQTKSDTSTLRFGLTEGGYYIITTSIVDPAQVKSLKEQILVSATSKELSVGRRMKLTVTLPTSLQLAAIVEKKDINEVSIQYTSSDKAVAYVTKTGVIVARKSGNVKITTTITLSDGSTFKYTTRITVK